MGIDYDLFAQKIFEYLTYYKKQISDLKSKNCGKNGCWGIISSLMYGHYNNLQSLELYSAWRNKSCNIRIKLVNKLNGMPILLIDLMKISHFEKLISL